jgi:hypothetical protein
MQQARISEAGHQAEAESRGMPTERGDEKNQQMQQKMKETCVQDAMQHMCCATDARGVCAMTVLSAVCCCVAAGPGPLN